MGAQNGRSPQHARNLDTSIALYVTLNAEVRVPVPTVATVLCTLYFAVCLRAHQPDLI